MSSSSATALAAAAILHWEVLPKGLLIVEYMNCGRHRCIFRVLSSLPHLEHFEREDNDLATEDGPLRAALSMDRRH